MIRADADPDGAIADCELADAVLAMHGRDRESRHGLGNDARAFLLGDRLMGLVLERLHGFAVVVVAHPPFERHAGPRRAAFEVALARGRIDDGRRDLERHRSYPPATGGKKSTSSPGDSEAFQSSSSSLIATLQRVIESANPCRRASSP